MVCLFSAKAKDRVCRHELLSHLLYSFAMIFSVRVPSILKKPGPNAEFFLKRDTRMSNNFLSGNSKKPNPKREVKRCCGQVAGEKRMCEGARGGARQPAQNGSGRVTST